MATAREVPSGPRRALSWRMIADWGPKHGSLPPLLLALTAVTGLVDAVSILRLGRVFVANMTGNVVFTGFALAGAPGFALSASLFALAGFLVGANAGGALTSRLGHDRAILLRAGAAAELVLVAAALLWAVLPGGPLSTAARDGIAALLAIAMGIQNAVARRLAVPDLTTTVLTMTLTGIAADIRAGDPGLANVRRRILPVLTMLAGGLVGALLVLHASTGAALGLATGLLVIVAAGAAVAARQPGQWRAGTR
jgi:uncharacterized membrane protein YoaK (UPF0700 family)